MQTPHLAWSPRVAEAGVAAVCEAKWTKENDIGDIRERENVDKIYGLCGSEKGVEKAGRQI